MKKPVGCSSPAFFMPAEEAVELAGAGEATTAEGRGVG